MNEFIALLIEHFAELVFAVISLMIAKYVVPFIKNEAIPWLKEKRIYDMVKKYVQAAEKISETTKFDKKAWVVNMLRDSGIEVTEEVDSLIESAVKELDIAVGPIIDVVVGDEIEDSVIE